MQRNIGTTIKSDENPPHTPVEPWLLERLTNKRAAQGYLEACLEDKDEPRLFPRALQDVIKANGGFSAVARKIGMGREALYRAVSLKTTPKLEVVLAILRGLDLQIRIPPRSIEHSPKHSLIQSPRRLKLMAKDRLR